MFYVADREGRRYKKSVDYSERKKRTAQSHNSGSQSSSTESSSRSSSSNSSSSQSSSSSSSSASDTSMSNSSSESATSSSSSSEYDAIDIEEPSPKKTVDQRKPLSKMLGLGKKLDPKIFSLERFPSSVDSPSAAKLDSIFGLHVPRIRTTQQETVKDNSIKNVLKGNLTTDFCLGDHRVFAGKIEFPFAIDDELTILGEKKQMKPAPRVRLIQEAQSLKDLKKIEKSGDREVQQKLQRERERKEVKKGLEKQKKEKRAEAKEKDKSTPEKKKLERFNLPSDLPSTRRPTPNLEKPIDKRPETPVIPDKLSEKPKKRHEPKIPAPVRSAPSSSKLNSSKSLTEIEAVMKEIQEQPIPQVQRNLEPDPNPTASTECDMELVLETDNMDPSVIEDPQPTFEFHTSGFAVDVPPPSLPIQTQNFTLQESEPLPINLPFKLPTRASIRKKERDKSPPPAVVPPPYLPMEDPPEIYSPSKPTQQQHHPSAPWHPQEPPHHPPHRGKDKGRGHPPPKETPCKFWESGHCRNGSRCAFLHSGRPGYRH